MIIMSLLGYNVLSLVFNLCQLWNEESVSNKKVERDINHRVKS